MASSDAPLIEEALPDELHLQRLSKLYAHGALGLFLSIACSIFLPGKALEHWYVRLLVFATSFITTTVCSKQLRLDTPTGKHVGLAIASVGLGISCSKYMTAQGVPKLMDATIKIVNYLQQPGYSINDMPHTMATLWHLCLRNDVHLCSGRSCGSTLRC